ncbi:MAG: hypothetical protein S4CHLAM2_15840 [Chlamydiales bacterium]|nr:hypothetical protein [Chlamydiales bacterium]
MNYVNSCIPLQYRLRAHEGEKILSVPEGTAEQVASKIAIAEAVQMAFFGIQTVLYALAFFGVIPPMAAGIAILCLVPVAAIASYHTLVHYKQFSRCILTMAAIVTLAMYAGLATYGVVTDSALTLCGGGIALHVFRNISEFIDARQSMRDAHYRHDVMGEYGDNQP